MVVGNLPAIGSTAILTKGGTPQAYCQGVSAGVKSDLIKEWCIGDADPKMIKRGHKSYPISIDALFTDFSFLNDILGGGTVQLIVYPGEGTATGEAKLTFTDVRFNDWELTITEDGPVLERVAGEAESMATDVVA